MFWKCLSHRRSYGQIQELSVGFWRDAMSTSVVKVNGVEVAMDDTKPTVININLNQPSALAGLLDLTKTALKGSKFPATVSKVFSGEQKVLGAVQIVIGLICVSFAVIHCFVREGNFYWSGAGFWTAFPFIVAGAVAVVSERRGGCCWRFLALLMQLVSLGVAIGAIVVTSGDLNGYWLYQYRLNPDQLCKLQQNNDYPYYRDYYRGYQTTAPTLESVNWRVKECKDAITRLLNVYYGANIMFFVSLCLALCLSVYSVACGIKSLCCACALQQEEEIATVGTDSEPLLTTDPPPYAASYAVEGPKVETI